MENDKEIKMDFTFIESAAMLVAGAGLIIVLNLIPEAIERPPIWIGWGLLIAGSSINLYYICKLWKGKNERSF